MALCTIETISNNTRRYHGSLSGAACRAGQGWRRGGFIQMDEQMGRRLEREGEDRHRSKEGKGEHRVGVARWGLNA
jgi:hypothetical protein